MADPLTTYIRRTLPVDLSNLLVDKLLDLERGGFLELLSLPLVKQLLGHDEPVLEATGQWTEWISSRIDSLLKESDHAISLAHSQHLLLIIAIAALHAFLQANITGPPLPFSTASLLFPRSLFPDSQHDEVLRTQLRASLTVDGEAAYKLTPNIELLCLSTIILRHSEIRSIKASAWARLRTDFVHQRILSEVSSALQESLYDGLDAVDTLLAVNDERSAFTDLIPAFLLEKAAIHIHHGLDSKARETLDDAARRRNFTFALTGHLGKRTKYQERDISQLVVLACSNDDSATEGSFFQAPETGLRPQALDLNDDTLLENISFTKRTVSAEILDSSNLPTALAHLDPSNQPLLDSLDSIILLSLASTITNTRPTDGLTREETLPYAQRVLSGGSSNWQVYTQALLIRSRIEGHRSRTTERGLLQLQALVDQVISETKEAVSDNIANGENDSLAQPVIAINDKPLTDAASTFLPRVSDRDSAPVSERLLYVHALASPTRWELEAELAARWVSLGGLRSALEIYERLEMWAEAALCWAATEREDKAKRIVKGLLFTPSPNLEPKDDTENENASTGDVFDGPLRDPAPADAPRLYCILGDMDLDVNMYEKAWEVSGGRYARAQRSIGRHWFSKSVSGGDVQECLKKAAAAYSKSLKINQLHGPSWFALGCVLLELHDFDKAAEAFARVVQLDETDAESWSNLATSLLKKGSTSSIIDDASAAALTLDDDDENPGSQSTIKTDPQQNIRAALRALRRAASLKHDSARIWDNLITVALSLSPPSFSDILTAERRVIAIRGPKDGEACVDADVLEALMREVVSIDYFVTNEYGNRIVNPQVTRGTPRIFIELLENHVTPLITTSPRLWRILSSVALWRARPGEALDALEKCWRAATAAPGWDDGSKDKWDIVVEATIELVDGYESLGDRQKETLSDQPVKNAELVAKDWKFKGRSAIRGITGKAKAAWEGTEGYERLRDRLEELKA